MLLQLLALSGQIEFALLQWHLHKLSCLIDGKTLAGLNTLSISVPAWRIGAPMNYCADHSIEMTHNMPEINGLHGPPVVAEVLINPFHIREDRIDLCQRLFAIHKCGCRLQSQPIGAVLLRAVGQTIAAIMVGEREKGLDCRRGLGCRFLYNFRIFRYLLTSPDISFLLVRDKFLFGDRLFMVLVRR